MKKEQGDCSDALDIAQISRGDNAIQIGLVQGNVTIVQLPASGVVHEGDSGQALSLLVIALILLTAGIATSHPELKLVLWLVGCSFAGLGWWNLQTKEER